MYHGVNGTDRDDEAGVQRSYVLRRVGDYDSVRGDVEDGGSLFFFSSRRRHTRLQGDWSSDVCSSDLIPGTMRAGDLMLEMQRGGQHLAVVLDEFGGTAGLVTFEDLLRDLVSELFEPDRKRGV